MKKIAVIGECMIEFYKNDDGLFKLGFAGDSFNCATYLKRSFKQATVEYITSIGDDDFSTEMVKKFHKEDLETTYVEKIENKNAGLYIINTVNGERSFSYWRGEAAAKELFTGKYLDKLKKDLLDFDLIYFSAISLAIMSEEGRKNLFKIIKKARKQGTLVAFDSNYRPKLYKNKDEARMIYKEAMPHCDIFLPSIDDEIDLWGESSPQKIIEKTVKAGVSEIVITCGKDDIIYHHNNVTKSKKTKQLKNIVDTTSAGDSFNGKYLASRLKSQSIGKSIKKAKKLASKVIMFKGAIIPKEVK